MLDGSEDTIYAFDALQNIFIGNSNIEITFLESFKVCLAFPEESFRIR